MLKTILREIRHLIPRYFRKELGMNTNGQCGDEKTTNTSGTE